MYTDRMHLPKNTNSGYLSYSRRPFEAGYFEDSNRFAWFCTAWRYLGAKTRMNIN